MKKSIKTNITKGLALLVCLVMVLACFMPMAVTTASASSKVSIKTSGGWLESAYVEWSEVSGADGYKVYVKKSGGSYSVIDDALIRKYKSSGGYYYRADALGLAAGSYVLKVVPVINGSESSSNSTETGSLTVTAYDRTGFAWVNGNSNGAYNADGTLKSNAVVIYVSEASKDTVSLTVKTGSSATTTATGLQNILTAYKKGYDSRPLCIRIIGKVTDPAKLMDGDIEVSGSGTSKKLTCGITIEGVGEDAVAYGWGIRIKNISNMEIRNLGTMMCDSSEGDNISLQQNNDHVWVHNCDFFYGMAGSDSDQAKGDGALDCKTSTYVTFSYNHFWDSGKCNLQGMKAETKENYITYHHNWYDHSDSRHPRIRTCTVHVYNNYYDGNSKYGVGATMGASVFVESNYFENCKYPMLISMQGNDIATNPKGTFSEEDGGIIKAYNNYMTGQTGFTSYSQNSVEFDAYVVNSASQTVPSSVTTKKGGYTYSNFDTASSMYSYTAQSPSAAKTSVMKYAGRMNGGDFEWTFTSADDSSYDVNTALKSKLSSYTSNVVSVGSLQSSSVSGNTSGSGSTGDTGSSSDSGSSGGSSSSGSGSTAVVGDYVHNFTKNGKTSSFYSITGNTSTSKGSVTYDGNTLSTCLKMETDTNISFNAPASGKLTLVFGGNTSATGKSVKFNGTKYTIDSTQVISFDVKTGSNTVTKGDSINLYYMVYEPDSSASGGSGSASDGDNTDSDGNDGTGGNTGDNTGNGIGDDSAGDSGSTGNNGGSTSDGTGNSTGGSESGNGSTGDNTGNGGNGSAGDDTGNSGNGSLDGNAGNAGESSGNGSGSTSNSGIDDTDSNLRDNTDNAQNTGTDNGNGDGNNNLIWLWIVIGIVVIGAGGAGAVLYIKKSKETKNN